MLPHASIMLPCESDLEPAKVAPYKLHDLFPNFWELKGASVYATWEEYVHGDE